MSRHPSKDPRLRLQLAQEAARIISETGLRDFAVAKCKAAANLRVGQTRNLPNNKEIEEALLSYQRLFQGDTQPALLHHLRQQAIAAMKLFLAFQPRLVGAVLNGSADQNSAVNLHLFADTQEQVGWFLMEHAIPFEHTERRMRTGPDSYNTYPLYRFIAGDTPVELTIFPVPALGHAPLSPVDGRPMRRAGLATVQQLLDCEPGVSQRL